MLASSSLILRLRQLTFVVILFPVVSCSTSFTDKLKNICRQHVVQIDRSIGSENCSGTAPFSEEDFHRCLPPPPCFTVPPPPPFISSDCGATYSWELVKTQISVKDDSVGDLCSKQEVTTARRLPMPTTASVKSLSSSPPSSSTASKPNGTRHHNKNKDRRKENEASKRSKPKGSDGFLSDVTAEDSTTCTETNKCKHRRKPERKTRGIPGPPGPQGPPGPPGTKGIDGLPGLVVFSDAASMFGVALEGLIAYRTDVKRLFVRDHLTWRPIRVAKCGDGIVDRDIGEQCDDGNDEIHDDCLGCRRSTCGDGIRNGRTEECDGRDFGEKTCATYRQGMTGPLTCTPECQISYQRCRHKRYLRR